MPTVNELLKKLPEDIAGKMEKNIYEIHRYKEFEDCCELLRIGFVWDYSTEGHDFWIAVYEDCIFHKI